MKTLFKAITILSLLALATSSDDQEYYKTMSPKALGLHKKEKLTHIHFFWHDVVAGKNSTVVHVAGPPLGADPRASFGSVVVIDDPLTVGPDPASKLIGRTQGIYASASQSDLSLLEIFNYVFTDGEFKGSSLSLLGRNAILEEVREMPILGGTGVFRFCRGYALLKTNMFNTTSGDAIVEYDVYVLH